MIVVLMLVGEVLRLVVEGCGFCWVCFLMWNVVGRLSDLFQLKSY